VAEKSQSFQWYWLLAREVTFAFYVIGVRIVVIRDIPPWAKFVFMFVLGLATHEASRYGERLRQRLGSKWVDRPTSWRVFWWSVAVIAVLTIAL
jgi:hypothetical protein